jgi:glycine cleavage system H protein
MLFSDEHVWLLVKGSTGTLGVTDFAQNALGPLVLAELPAIGQAIRKNTSCGTLESMKTASDVIAPIDAHVLEVNQSVVETPERINEEPEGAGWLLRLALGKDASVDHLLDRTGYDGLLAKL